MGEPSHVSDLRDEHCSMDCADPGELLNRSIPDIVAQLLVKQGRELADLGVVNIDQVP